MSSSLRSLSQINWGKMTPLGTGDPALTQALSASPAQAPPLSLNEAHSVPRTPPAWHSPHQSSPFEEAQYVVPIGTKSEEGQDALHIKISYCFSCSFLFSKTHRFPSLPSWQEPKNPATSAVCRIPLAESHSASAWKLLDMGNSHFPILSLVNCVRMLFFLIKTKYRNFAIINFTGTLGPWIHRRPRTALRGKLTYLPSPFLLQRAFFHAVSS